MDVTRIATRSSVRHLLKSPNIQQSFHPRLFDTQTQSTFRTRPASLSNQRCLYTKAKRPLPLQVSSTVNQPMRRWESSDRTIDSTPESSLTLAQRMKKLSKEYGWAALYIYLGLSALDFPFCFLAVKMLGTDLIGHWEHVIVSNVTALLQWPISGTVQEQIGEAVDKISETVEGQDTKRILEEGPGSPGYMVEDHGYKEAEAASRGNNATIWTQLALAYAIHKSFIFVRVPLTAAVTPKIVKTLRGWGWNIGRPRRPSKSGKGGGGDAGVNTKGSGVKPDD